jgi:hypothetical protein
MDDLATAERYELALRVVQKNLEGTDLFDSWKPMSAQSCASLSQYIQHILDGATPQEAADRMTNG